jgi:hypothetical protein
VTLTQPLDAGAPGIIAILRGVQPEAVLEVAAAGGRLIVSPNMDRTVVEQALQQRVLLIFATGSRRARRESVSALPSLHRARIPQP